MTDLNNVSSTEAKAKMDPKIGPMQGVHPNPKAKPITYGNKTFLDFFTSNLFSKFKKLILIIPINCKDKIIIIIPATILKISEFCKKICPIKETVAPRIIKTVEKPRQNSKRGVKFIFLFSKISFND